MFFLKNQHSALIFYSMYAHFFRNFLRVSAVGYLSYILIVSYFLIK